MSSGALFRPFKLKGLNLPNRVVMAPMTRSFSPGGIPTEDVARYYRRRAEGESPGDVAPIVEGSGVAGKSQIAHHDRLRSETRAKDASVGRR